MDDSGDDISPRVIAAIGRDAPFNLMIVIDMPSNDESIKNEFLEAAKLAESGSQKEDGCFRYSFFRDAEVQAGQPARFYLLESWRDSHALIRHFEQSHVVPLLTFLDAKQCTCDVRVLAQTDIPIISTETKPVPARPEPKEGLISHRVNAILGPNQPFAIIAIHDLPKTVSAEQVEKFFGAMRTVVAVSEKEHGCSFYQCLRDVDAPMERVVVLQSFKDHSALMAHFHSEQMQLLQQAAKEVQTAAGFVIAVQSIHH